MGKPMARHLITAGHRLTVHNRSRDAVNELAVQARRPPRRRRRSARQADIVITMLPDTPDVELVLAGEAGVLSALRPGAIVIDMSSISPVATVTACGRCRASRADRCSTRQ